MISSVPLRIGLYEKALSNKISWEEKFDIARKSGFDFVEMNIDGSDDRLCRLYDEGKSARYVTRASEECGFSVLTMALTANRAYPLGSEDVSVRERAVEIVTRAVDYALAAGIRLIHLAAYDDHGEKCCAATERNFFRSVERCVSYASRYGVILALETMDTGFMAGGEAVASVVRAFSSPFLQCYADVGNLTANGIDAPSEILKISKHIVGIHLKDARAGIARDVPFGEGDVDFVRVGEALSRARYAGILVAEMWSYDDASFHSYLPAAGKFLREKLASYAQGS
ncbi:MAG: L-ribulose-5-phosphate 3-epimerase [Synergistaceae bacterium]|jgi:predicted hexulose-6-phosphate isomerase|nr:L-ribulose-5-phosphate 3-epimerase [Synergistaceae bacterium]